MCFSATASFVAAAGIGAMGLAALRRVAAPRNLGLAAMPIVFAVQQFIEGMLWLTLADDPGSPLSAWATALYLFFGEVWWPVFVPVAILLIETQRWRRRLMFCTLGLGVAVGAYLLWGMLARGHRAEILDGHIVYLTEEPQSLLVGLAYLIATTLPLLASSQRVVATLGAVVLVGGIATYFFYWQAFVSVWCFFGAAVSGLILLHFQALRKHARPAAAGS